MKAAMELAELAVANGWTIKVTPQEDLSGHPFITVEGVRGHEAYFTATWHTREVGTYRLFQSSCGRSRHQSSTASLRRIREAIAA